MKPTDTKPRKRSRHRGKLPHLPRSDKPVKRKSDYLTWDFLTGIDRFPIRVKLAQCAADLG